MHLGSHLGGVRETPQLCPWGKPLSPNELAAPEWKLSPEGIIILDNLLQHLLGCLLKRIDVKFVNVDINRVSPSPVRELSSPVLTRRYQFKYRSQ